MAGIEEGETVQTGRKPVEQDYVIEQVLALFPCRVLWSEGRPCLEYNSDEDLARIGVYVNETFGVELLDVFFTAIESIKED